MKQIQLTQNKCTQVSDHRFEYLNQWKWFAHQDENGKWYAMRNIRSDNGCRSVEYMHRHITNAPKGTEVDHKDHDGLNNTDENLRISTRTQNQGNRKLDKRNTSGYKGVRWDRTRNKWLAQITKNGIPTHLGRFENLEDAAKAYDTAAKKYFGEFAKLNFEKES